MATLFLVVELLGIFLVVYILFKVAIACIPELNHWWGTVTKKQNIKLAKTKIETVEETQEDLRTIEKSVKKLSPAEVRKRRNSVLNHIPKE